MKSILITGGAGFIGVNSARYFLKKGWTVILLDNLSRQGAAENLRWLSGKAQFRFERADVRDRETIHCIMDEVRPDVVLHLAGQVAVTTSVENPREDFEINALGTLNVLEAIRGATPTSFFINAATNKVYGKMEDVGAVDRNGRYEYEKLPNGVSEDQPLDFHSPYGCSKGVADQYSIDYARIYGLQTVSFRQSCIYGPRQFGIEDQGWVAWFTIASVIGKPITIYGDGKQIRDVLHVEDLARAYEAAWECREKVAGQALNIGGGPCNTYVTARASPLPRGGIWVRQYHLVGVTGVLVTSPCLCVISTKQSGYLIGRPRLERGKVLNSSLPGCETIGNCSTDRPHPFHAPAPQLRMGSRA